jgi:hypothetical protein
MSKSSEDDNLASKLDKAEEVLRLVLVQRITVAGAIADQIFRLGFDHVEVEAGGLPGGGDIVSRITR